MVNDLIGIAPSNNGSVLPHATCRNDCSPADSQQATVRRRRTDHQRLRAGRLPHDDTEHLGLAGHRVLTDAAGRATLLVRVTRAGTTE